MNTPSYCGEKLIVAGSSPGEIVVASAPPPGPYTAWKSTLCISAFESSGTSKVRFTRSPRRTRSIGPGTFPLNVMYVNSTPGSISAVSSSVRSVTSCSRGSFQSTGSGTSVGSRAIRATSTF